MDWLHKNALFCVFCERKGLVALSSQDEKRWKKESDPSCTADTKSTSAAVTPAIAVRTVTSSRRGISITSQILFSRRRLASVKKGESFPCSHFGPLSQERFAWQGFLFCQDCKKYDAAIQWGSKKKKRVTQLASNARQDTCQQWSLLTKSRPILVSKE